MSHSITAPNFWEISMNTFILLTALVLGGADDTILVTDLSSELQSVIPANVKEVSIKEIRFYKAKIKDTTEQVDNSWPVVSKRIEDQMKGTKTAKSSKSCPDCGHKSGISQVCKKGFTG